ncbi:MAG: mechanosensitive ion channel domain-containing protein [Gilvibacter sp.]
MAKILAIFQDDSLVDEAKEISKSIGETIMDFLSLGIHLGEGDKAIHLTIGHMLLLIVALVATSWVLKWTRVLLTKRMEQSNKLKFVSIFKFIKYFIYVIVIIFTMSAAGIDVTVLLTASAALFVGLGLALQELFQDVIGGIFIITDKSLLVGDIIEINGKVGRVIEIKLRTTRALTRDDKVIIIPNHKFISDTIYNYTQNHKMTRESVKVGVAYGSDTTLVKELMLTAANEQEGILEHPKPFVLFEDFGDSALQFSVYFFISDSFIDPNIKSDMRFRIDDSFREHNITIPFPQRVVHLQPTDKQ